MESRLFAFAVSLLDRNLVPSLDKNLDIEIPVLAFAQAFNLDNSQAYSEIEALAEKIEAKRIWLAPNETLTGNRIKTRLLTEQEYIDGEGRIIIQFNRHLVPHLLGLKDKFTQYRIQDVYQFTRASSWRVYELLRQYKSIGRREFELEEFKRATSTTGRYPRITDLRARVIDPAVVEINKTSDITVEYGQVRCGKRIAGLVFIIRDNVNTKTPRERVRAVAEKLRTTQPGLQDSDLYQMLTKEFRLGPVQARDLVSLATGQEARVLKILDKIKASFSKLPDKRSIGAYTFAALKSELTKQLPLPLSLP